MFAQSWTRLALLCSIFFFLVSPIHTAPTQEKACPKPKPCTKKNTLIRKEWGSLSKPQRLDFIRSVKCLQKLPSKIPASEGVPGAKSRFDDFTASHINQTFYIHLNGKFLTWHRQYLNLLEIALREECAYQGALPYWNWPLYPQLQTSPLFDGSEFSLGGDGEFDPNSERAISGADILPKGTGGGCVRTGPFANLTLSFRNFPQISGFNGNFVLPPDALTYQPHCLRRDLNNAILANNTALPAVKALLDLPDIEAFAAGIDAGFGVNFRFGLHAGGHFSVGKDLWDFVASPGEPAFYLHHAMIDNLYAAWQKKDPATRLKTTAGAVNFLNLPPGPNVTTSTLQTFPYIGSTKTIGQLLDTKGSDLCYEYDYHVAR